MHAIGEAWHYMSLHIARSFSSMGFSDDFVKANTNHLLYNYSECVGAIIIAKVHTFITLKSHGILQQLLM